MKTPILLLLLFTSIIAKGQSEEDKINMYDSIGVVYRDTIVNNLCKERGHVLSEIEMSTSLYCPSYIIDTDSTTIQVYPACNWVTYVCKRCGEEISERNKERRIVLWKKE